MMTIPYLAYLEKLQVRVLDNRQSLGKTAAHLVGQKINELLTYKATINMIFAAAPSQNEFLEEFIQLKGIAWNRIRAFHMDEYIGLTDSAPQRFGNFLRTKLFSKVPFLAVHYINGNADDSREECARYAALLAINPPDIACMGIGENTHIAFNDPHVADFKDPHHVKIVALDNACRQQQVNDGCFGAIDDVPTEAMTLTIPSLMQAKFVYCMVPGKNKAQAILHTLKEPISEKFPSTILRLHNAAVLFIDEDSAALLNTIVLNQSKKTSS
jgi:glucosamine-6-phosphate deaminase